MLSEKEVVERVGMMIGFLLGVGQREAVAKIYQSDVNEEQKVLDLINLHDKHAGLDPTDDYLTPIRKIFKKG